MAQGMTRVPGSDLSEHGSHSTRIEAGQTLANENSMQNPRPPERSKKSSKSKNRTQVYLVPGAETIELKPRGAKPIEIKEPKGAGIVEISKPRGAGNVEYSANSQQIVTSSRNDRSSHINTQPQGSGVHNYGYMPHSETDQRDHLPARQPQHQQQLNQQDRLQQPKHHQQKNQHQQNSLNQQQHYSPNQPQQPQQQLQQQQEHQHYQQQEQQQEQHTEGVQEFIPPNEEDWTHGRYGWFSARRKQMECPFCGHEIITHVTFESGEYSKYMGRTLCCCCCCCLAWIPYTMDKYKDAIHHCPLCHNLLGVHERKLKSSHDTT